MSKDYIIPELIDAAIKDVDSLQALYSSCIKIFFCSTEKLNVGFNNKELVSWIKENRPEVFDEKGKKNNVELE